MTVDQVALVREFDPFRADVRRNPYPYYAALRDHSPVHHLPDRNLWIVSRYEDVLAVLRQPGIFSSASGMGALMRGELSGQGARTATGTLDLSALRVLIATDPPDHTTLRRIVSRPFTPSAIGGLEARVAQIARECVDALEATARGGEGDFVAQLAEPLPVLVIAEMLGIPTARRAQFKEWSDRVVGVLSGSAPIDAGQESMLEMVDFFSQIASERRQSPRDDLISVLVSGSDDGRLEPMEIVVFAILLLIAGNETTTNLLTALVTALWDHPNIEDALRQDPALIANAVEESLRYDAPVQALLRGTLTRTELAGAEIPEGSLVMVAFASANRDERAFESANAFRIDRQDNAHLGFGAGIHLCLGAALARLEARLAMQELLGRPYRLRPRPGAERIDSFILRGFARLPVSLDAA
jgi:cytochrome P450